MGNAIQDYKNRKTYKTYDNAVAAVYNKGLETRRYVICATPEGRYFPVFIGTENIDVIHVGFAVVG